MNVLLSMQISYKLCCAICTSAVYTLSLFHFAMKDDLVWCTLVKMASHVRTYVYHACCHRYHACFHCLHAWSPENANKAKLHYHACCHRYYACFHSLRAWSPENEKEAKFAPLWFRQVRNIAFFYTPRISETLVHQKMPENDFFYMHAGQRHSLR